VRLELKNTDEIARQNEAMPENEIAPIQSGHLTVQQSTVNSNDKFNRWTL